MSTRPLLLAFCVAAVSCGGSSSGTPTTPSPPVQPPATSWSLSGIVSDAVTGAGVANATLAFSTLPSATTDAQGRWRLEGSGASPGTSVIATTIAAPGFYDRDTRIQWRADKNETTLTLFPQRAPFSLDFFRMLIRDGFTEPDSLDPVRRWTSNPNFYLNATNPKTHQKLRDSEIEMIEQTVRAAVPQATGGNLSVGAFEVGTAARAERFGYINIDIIYDPASDSCGEAFVGANPGGITLNYEGCVVSWCRDAISPNVVAHETGHAMGLWHVPHGMMTPALEDCRGITFTQEEQLHARMAYQRPAGNRDVDRDPSTFQALVTDAPRRVICHNAPKK